LKKINIKKFLNYSKCGFHKKIHKPFLKRFFHLKTKLIPNQQSYILYLQNNMDWKNKLNNIQNKVKFQLHAKKIDDLESLHKLIKVLSSSK